MNNHRPNNWVVLEFGGPKPHYRVLGGWSGGYLDGNSWRLNSGITRVEETDKDYLFYGSSGSCYTCDKESNIVRMNIAPILNHLKETYGDKVQVLESDVDYMNIDWLLSD